MTKRQNWNSPRDLSNGSWYYVNRNSIEFVAYSSDLGSVVSVLRERDLVRMLSDMRLRRKPQKRTATKARDAKRAVTTVGAQRKK